MKKILLLTLLIAGMMSPVKAQELYVVNSKGGLDPAVKAVVSGTKTGGKTLLAAYGAKLTTSLVIDGSHAPLMLPQGATSFYVFTPKNLSIQSWKLVELKTKKKTRELPFMKTSAYSGTTTKIEDLSLHYDRITDEVYKLTALENLGKGEYAIVRFENGAPVDVYDFRIETSLPPFSKMPEDEAVLAEFYPNGLNSNNKKESNNGRFADEDLSKAIVRWYFDSEPRGARIFYRVISNVPAEVKNTNESYLTTTPLEETKSVNIPGLTYENSNDVVIEIKVTKRGYEDQVKRYNLRQVLDQQEISGFYELVQK